MPDKTQEQKLALLVAKGAFTDEEFNTQSALSSQEKSLSKSDGPLSR